MSAQEKDELLRRFHPDYRQDGFVYLAVGPNKGDKVPTELGNLLHGKKPRSGPGCRAGRYILRYRRAYNRRRRSGRFGSHRGR